MSGYPFLHEWDPSRFPETYLRFAPLEAAVQLDIIQLLVLRYRARVTVIDVGDARFRGRAKAIIAAAGGNPRLLNPRGGAMERGIVDLAITFQGGRAGWIEVKKPARYARSPKTGKLIIASDAGQPTEEQLEFLAEQHRHGAVAGVAWGRSDLGLIIPAELARAA